MLNRPKQKQTLERQRPSFWQHELGIKISLTILIILALIVCIVIIFMICPPTYGYLWY